MFYKECPVRGVTCIERKEACTAGTEQASSALNATKLYFNYTTSKGVLSSGINAL